jgi:hypothetical protein
LGFFTFTQRASGIAPGDHADDDAENKQAAAIQIATVALMGLE